LPAGVPDPGESPLAAAAREAEEETGWRPHSLRRLLELTPGAGLSDCVHRVFWTDQAECLGPPPDVHEAVRVDWISLADVPRLISAGQIRESSTVAALLQLHVLRLAR
jgi:8-oxo-dGTP pyrophosphatase MutT (NUDIX family)